MFGLFKTKNKENNKFDFDFLKEQNKIHTGKIIYSEPLQGQGLEECVNNQTWDANIVEINYGGLINFKENLFANYEIDLFKLFMSNGSFISKIEEIKDFILKMQLENRKWIVSIDTSRELEALGTKENNIDFKIKVFISNLIFWINSDDFPKQENKLLVKINTRFEDLDLLDCDLLYKSQNIFYSIIVLKQDISNFHKKFGSMFDLFENNYFLKVFNKSSPEKSSFGSILYNLHYKYFEKEYKFDLDFSNDGITYLSKHFETKQFKHKPLEKIR